MNVRSLQIRRPSLPSLSSLRWRRKPAEGAPAPAIGRYAHRSWLRRHKAMCFIVLTLFSLIYGFAFAIFGRFLFVQLTAPLVVLAGITLWVLPDMDRAPDKLLGKTFTAFLFALLCWPDYIAFAVPGLPWVTAIRLFGAPMALTLLICVSVSARFRARMGDILSAEPLIWKLLVAFTVIAGLSIALSRNIPASVNKFVVAQMAWTAVFFISCYVFVQPGRVRTLSKYLWAISIYCCIIALYEVRYSKLPWAGRIPWFLKIEDEQVLRVLGGLSRAFTGVYRVQSKFGISLGLGEFFGLALPFILHLIVTSRRWSVRIAGLLTLPLIFFITLKTDSRLAFISFVASMLGYLLFWSYRYWRNNRESILGSALIFGYPVGFAGFVALALVWRRLEVLVFGGGAQQSSTDSRKEQYRMGFRLLRRNPIGNGIGEGAQTLGYTAPDGTITIDTYYLVVALEYGVIGFLIYYAMFLWATWRAARIGLNSRDPDILFLVPAAIALTNFVISKSVFSQQENHSLAFMLLGMVIALSWRAREQLRSRPTAR